VKLSFKNSQKRLPFTEVSHAKSIKYVLNFAGITTFALQNLFKGV
jgi:hypothetical protein